LAQGGAPTVVSYQGEVRVGGTPYTGTGYFKFAIVNAAGTHTYWSNDGTSVGGSEPSAAVPLAVSDGLFSVLLGNSGMTALTAGVFSEPDRYLRVWFSQTGLTGSFVRLEPDTRIGAVPYALQAEEAKQAASAPWSGITGAPDFREKYAQVVIVAKSGGDYTSVQAAIDSITDAAADNPYLVWVAPGVYVEQVTMKPYVHLQGAGQEATVITSTASTTTWPPDVATLKLASNTSLRDLTVGNSGAGTDTENVALLATDGTTQTLVADVTAKAQGSGTYNYGVFLTGSGTGVTLQHVTALGENGSSNYGLYNRYGAATLRGGSFTGRGGENAWGIYNSGSGTTLEAESVTALGENGTYNYGLTNSIGAAATLRGGSFTGRGGTSAEGIYNSGSGTKLEAESVTALGENGGLSNYGLYNTDGATASATQSVLEGGTNSVVRISGTVTVSNSRLVGGAVYGTVTCVAVSRGTTFNASGCP
jgi:hypothetical protein